jgi:hypothetical protein
MTDPIDDLDNKILKYPSLDLKIVRENVPTFDSVKLAEMIVCDRYFGCYREIAVLCMEELGKRRITGEQFDFESYIEKALAELPKLDFSVPDLGDVLRQVIGKKISK